MAIEAGRVGVRADQVDPYGRVLGGGGGTDPAVTKLQTQVGSYSFRTNPEDGSAQYKQSDSGEWKNFSAGGGGATLLWENSAPNNAFSDLTISADFSGYDKFIVLAKYDNATDNVGYAIVSKDENWHEIVGGALTLASDVYDSHRFIKISDSEAEFYVNYGQSVGARSGSYSNAAYCIPTKIYGVDLTI